MGIYIEPRAELTQIRRAAKDRARLKLLRNALNDISRARIMDSVTAIHMRAIATAALKTLGVNSEKL